MPENENNIEQILSLYENNTELLIEKVDELRIILDTLMPLQYIINLSKSIDNFKDHEVVKLINEDTKILELSEKLCSVCIIKEKYVEYTNKFIQTLDSSIEADIADAEPYFPEDSDVNEPIGEEFSLDED